jgi:hypothetical protein
LGLRDPGYAFKFERLHARLAAPGPRPLLVVMLGSSHVADGLRGQLIEADLARELGAPVIVFNLGNPADGPVQELLKLERLLAAGIHPDLLLLEFIPSYLTANATDHLLGMPSFGLGLRDRAILRNARFPVERLAQINYRYWLLPWASHQQEMLSVFCPRLMPEPQRLDRARFCDGSGWVEPWYPPSEESRRRATRLALENHAFLKDYRLGNPFSPLYRAVLARCSREGIPTGLVLMPESSAFRALYAPDAWRQLDGLLGELGREFGVPAVLARDWVDDGAFYDGHHLLPEGAAVFTRRLAREVLAPRLRNVNATSVPTQD